MHRLGEQYYKVNESCLFMWLYRYELMHTTWFITPEDRPTFEQLVRSLSQLCPHPSPQTENPYWVLELPNTQSQGKPSPPPSPPQGRTELGLSHSESTGSTPKHMAGASPNFERSSSDKPVDAVDEVTYDNVEQIYDEPTDSAHHYENEDLRHYENGNFDESIPPPAEYEVPVSHSTDVGDEAATSTGELQDPQYHNLPAVVAQT